MRKIILSLVVTLALIGFCHAEDSFGDAFDSADTGAASSAWDSAGSNASGDAYDSSIGNAYDSAFDSAGSDASGSAWDSAGSNEAANDAYGVIEGGVGGKGGSGTSSGGGGASSSGGSASGGGSGIDKWLNKITGNANPTSNTASDGLNMPENFNVPRTDLEKIINAIIKLLFAVGQIGFVIMLVFGAVLLITSAGNEAQVDRAKKTITYAILGIVLLFFTWAIVEFVINLIKSTEISKTSTQITNSKTADPISTPTDTAPKTQNTSTKTPASSNITNPTPVPAPAKTPVKQTSTNNTPKEAITDRPGGD